MWVVQQRALHRFADELRRRTERLRATQVVRVDDRDVQPQRGRQFGAHAVWIGGAEHDRAFVGRQRAGVAVDRGDRVAQQVVEHAALTGRARGDVRDRGTEDPPRADVVDHELQRFRLVHGRERSGAARQNAREQRRADRLRADEAALRDRDRRLGDRHDVARARGAAERVAQEFGQVVAAADQAGAHGDRDEPRREFGIAHGRRDHSRSPATICSMWYMREPLSNTTSSGWACSRSQATASSLPA